MTAWTLPQRTGFRFLFAYLALYTTALGGLSGWVVPWMGAHVLGMAVKPAMNGSGDTLFDWVRAFCVLVLAILATLVWSFLDRTRPHYRALHGYLRAWLRYGLGTALIVYGMAKVIQSQFPHPSADRLVQTYGESSPMGLLWTFMGFSAGYNLFAGLAETVPGVLLFFRRTSLLGALLGAAALANVVALNFSFDVPVKIFSTHLLLIALVIAAPDLPRLAGLFLLEPPAPPALARPRLVRAWQFAKVGLLALLIGFLGYFARQQRSLDAAGGERAFQGFYRVEEFHGNLEERWSEAVFTGGRLLIRHAGGAAHPYQWEASERELTLIDGYARRYVLATRQPQPDTLEIKGNLSGAPLEVVLRKRAGGFLLEERGFHWVNEMPFNR